MGILDIRSSWKGMSKESKDVYKNRKLTPISDATIEDLPSAEILPKESRKREKPTNKNKENDETSSSKDSNTVFF